MVQVPVLTKLTVSVETVQTPVVWLVKVTGRPEVEEAETLKSAEPKALSASGPKLMVWSALVKVTVTGSEVIAL